MRLLAATLIILAATADVVAAQGLPTDDPRFTLVAGVSPTPPQDPSADVGDGGPATLATLGAITSLDLTPTGELLISEVGEPSRIRIVSTTGRISTQTTDVDTPMAVVGARGAFAVADQNRVHVFAFGEKKTLRPDAAPDLVRDLAYAGPGHPNAIFGDLWVANSDDLGLLFHLGTDPWRWDPHPTSRSTGVTERPGGGVYYTQRETGACHVLRRVGPTIPVVVAGEGDCNQDPAGTATGRPAKDVSIGPLEDVEATPDGGLVIVEQTRVSRVAPDGTFSVIYDAGYGGDTPRPQPDGIEVTPDGDVLFSLGSQVYRYDGNFADGPPPPLDPIVPLPTPTPAPQPPPPPTPTPKLTAAITKSSYTVRRGKRLTLKVTASQAGRYRLDVLRKTKRVKRLTGNAKRGTNTVAFKVTLKPGTYRLSLTVTAATLKGTDTARLRVKRR